MGLGCPADAVYFIRVLRFDQAILQLIMGLGSELVRVVFVLAPPLLVHFFILCLSYPSVGDHELNLSEVFSFIRARTAHIGSILPLAVVSALSINVHGDTQHNQKQNHYSYSPVHASSLLVDNMSEKEGSYAKRVQPKLNSLPSSLVPPRGFEPLSSP